MPTQFGWVSSSPRQKLRTLQAYLRSLQGAVVAFSGGVDSAIVAAIASGTPDAAREAMGRVIHDGYWNAIPAGRAAGG